jgi:methylase of polypeptide subunit release factors
LELSGHKDMIKDFYVDKGVWNPAIFSAQYHASYLYYNNARLFSGKTVLDMGTGTGLMGVVMALAGAKKVVMSDISLAAVTNSNKNIKNFNLEDKALAIQSDLFEKVKKKFDFIVFNHPFFGDDPLPEDTIAASMLNSGDLIKRFLQAAPNYLNEGATIMMPFYDKAGETNNPVIQGPKYGFKVVTTFKTNSETGLQTGEISIHKLTIKN